MLFKKIYKRPTGYALLLDNSSGVWEELRHNSLWTLVASLEHHGVSICYTKSDEEITRVNAILKYEIIEE